MKCEVARKSLALLDDHVSAPPSDLHGVPWVRVQAHLANCTNCRKYLEAIRLSRALLQEVKPPALSNEYLDDFTARVADQLVSERGLWAPLKHWFELFELAPLPTLIQATAVLGTVCVLALQLPGVESVLRVLTRL